MDEIISQPPQRSVSIAEYKLDISNFKKVKQGNKRAEAINRMTVALGIEAKYRRGLVFQTKLLTDAELENIFSKALAFKANPAAFFRKLIRAKIEEIKKRL